MYPPTSWQVISVPCYRILILRMRFPTAGAFLCVLKGVEKYNSWETCFNITKFTWTQICSILCTPHIQQIEQCKSGCGPVSGPSLGTNMSISEKASA